MIRKVGITGGIGSGKSYVCKVLEHMGFPVYYSDKESKILTDYDPTIKLGLVQLFGAEIYQNERLNKPLLAEKIFQNDDLLQKVNAIIHPIVRLNFQQWATLQRSNIVFNESALLIETESYKTFDFIVLVVAEKHKRIERIMQRDGSSLQEIHARMDKQLQDEQKKLHADFIVYNNGEELLVQIEKMIAQITTIS